MSYDFHSRLDYLGTRKKELTTKTVTLQRSGETDTTGVTTNLEITKQEAVSDTGQVITSYRRDYIFDTADYAFNDVVSLPQLGDLIVDGSMTCRVIHQEDGEDCFRYTTGSKNRIRVHTKVQ